jgi:hypothetical protein
VGIFFGVLDFTITTDLIPYFSLSHLSKKFRLEWIEISFKFF